MRRTRIAAGALLVLLVLGGCSAKTVDAGKAKTTDSAQQTSDDTGHASSDDSAEHDSADTSHDSAEHDSSDTGHDSADSGDHDSASPATDGGTGSTSTPLCTSDALWEAARTSQNIDPNDPGYADPAKYGEGPGVYHVACAGDWASAPVSRPYTGLTDAEDVFHWVDGHWTWVANPGPPIATCRMEKLGMPDDVIQQLYKIDPQVDAEECTAS